MANDIRITGESFVVGVDQCVRTIPVVPHCGSRASPCKHTSNNASPPPEPISPSPAITNQPITAVGRQRKRDRTGTATPSCAVTRACSVPATSTARCGHLVESLGGVGARRPRRRTSPARSAIGAYRPSSSTSTPMASTVRLPANKSRVPTAWERSTGASAGILFPSWPAGAEAVRQIVQAPSSMAALPRRYCDTSSPLRASAPDRCRRP